MKNKKTVVLLLLLAFLVLHPALAFDLGSKNFFDIPPAAGLVSPIGEEVNLSGQATLEFRWRNIYPADTDSFDFRIYKGYGPSAADLIMKQTVDSREESIEIDTKLFQDGQTYTWSLVRITSSGLKSDRVCHSFKVIKS